MSFFLFFQVEDRLCSLAEEKKKIAEKVQERLETIEQTDGSLTAKKSKQLASLVEFAHPKQTRKQGISTFLILHREEL